MKKYSFKMRRGMIIGQSALNEAVQTQVYKNIVATLEGLLESKGIFGDNISNTKDNTSLQAYAHTGSLFISAGQGITSNNEFVVLDSNYNVPLGSVDDGYYFIYIAPAIEYENGEGYTFDFKQAGTHIQPYENVGAQVSLVSCTQAGTPTLSPDSLCLGKVYVRSGGVDSPVDVTLNNEIVDVSYDGLLTYTGSLGAAEFSDMPYVQIDDEIIEATESGGDIDILSRQNYSSNAKPYYEGATITWSPVIDLRHYNMAIIRGGNATLRTITKGLIDFGDGSGFRQLLTSKVASVPNTPGITSDDLSLVWLNKQIGLQSNDTRESAKSVTKAKSRVDQLSEEVANITREMLDENTESFRAEMAQQLERKRADLISAQILYKDAVNGFKSKNEVVDRSKKYALNVVVPQPELVDNERIIKYEAEVFYLPLNTGDLGMSSNIPSYVSSPCLVAQSWTPYGDPEYGDQIVGNIAKEEFRSVMIPIKYGERAKIRVRAYSETNRVSAWSNFVEYRFDAIDNIDVVKYNELLDAVYPDPLQMQSIGQETVQYLQTLMTTFQDSIAQISHLQNTVLTIQNQIEVINDKIRDLFVKDATLTQQVADSSQESNA